MLLWHCVVIQVITVYPSSPSSRPGIVDLPSDGGVVSTDAITLPEIFHDFETAVADLGSVHRFVGPCVYVGLCSS